MEKKNHLRKGIFALLVAAATLAGCSKDSDSNDSPTPTPPIVQDPYKEWPIKPKIKEGETSYISFYIENKEINGVDFNFKGNGWIDLNNNGVQDPDEKSEIFDGSDKNYSLQSRTFTLYGNITSLIVTDNALKGLDISHAPALQEVKADVNKINVLNLKENKALTKLNVYDNEFHTLDLKENKALTELNVDSNRLSALDLRENKALTELNVDNNQLSTLDLKENKYLTKLNVSYNQLSALDISTDSQLKEVDLVSNKLSEEVMLKIVENLPQREEAHKGIIFLQTFQIVDGKQAAENNKVNKEILEKLDAKKWKALFINKKGYHREYNGNPNAPHETP